MVSQETARWAMGTNCHSAVSYLPRLAASVSDSLISSVLLVDIVMMPQIKKPGLWRLQSLRNECEPRLETALHHELRGSTLEH